MGDREINRACSECGTELNDEASNCRRCGVAVSRAGLGSDRATRAPSQHQIRQRAAALRRAHLELKRPAPKPKEKQVETGRLRLFSARLLGRTLRVRYLGVA